jgi:hypothetical protein
VQNTNYETPYYAVFPASCYILQITNILYSLSAVRTKVRHTMCAEETTCKYCHDFGVWAWLIREVLDWMITFFDTLYIHLRTTGNYSATAISTLHNAPLHTH